MSHKDDSLRLMVYSILSEYVTTDKKIVDSTVSQEDEEVRAITSKSAVALLERLKSVVPKKLEGSRETEKEFEAVTLRTWKKPFDLLDLLLYLSLQVSGEFNLEYLSDEWLKNSLLQVALAKQQAKACLVFDEILHLLKSGFPSGAHSHWRTLHEIACVSYFISKHGEDMAKRFLDYEVVERYYRTLSIYDHQQKMEFETLPEKDLKANLKAIKKKIDKMQKLYGSDFVKKTSYPFGWVPRTALKSRSLREMEKAVKLDMLRPYYNVAIYDAYGRSKGLVSKSVITKNKRKNAVIPFGPSNYGLADPGRSAAISLGQVTACLLLSESTLNRLVIVEAMRNLVAEICAAFSEVQSEFGVS